MLVPGMPLLMLLFLPNVVGAILLPVILILMLKVVNDPRSWATGRTRRAGTWRRATVTGALIVLTVVYGFIAVLQATGVVSG